MLRRWINRALGRSSTANASSTGTSEPRPKMTDVGRQKADDVLVADREPAAVHPRPAESRTR